MLKSGPVVKLNVPLTSWPTPPPLCQFQSPVDAVSETHLSVRKNISRRHTPRCPHPDNELFSPHDVRTSTSPHFSLAFIPNIIGANGEGKQQLKQRRFLAHVKWLQLSLFRWKWASSGPAAWFSCLQEILLYSAGFNTIQSNHQITYWKRKLHSKRWAAKTGRKWI